MVVLVVVDGAAWWAIPRTKEEALVVDLDHRAAVMMVVEGVVADVVDGGGVVDVVRPNLVRVDPTEEVEEEVVMGVVDVVLPGREEEGEAMGVIGPIWYYRPLDLSWN